MDVQRPFFDQLVGKRIAGRYLVERMLGSGGMGIVTVARYPELGQKVAIKFLRPELGADPVVSARFMREARVAAKVKSPHFVRVFDVGRLESGVPYLVMEMLTGRDLGDELRARGPLAISEAVDCIVQAAAGVAEIHALGIVHRDLKPSNLFLTTAAGTPIVKVLDFGISKDQKAESDVPLTGTDHVLGTPQYMSPEQVRASKDVDVRSDVWSLGVILYELVTQELPFRSEGGGIGEMFGKILYVDPDPPSMHRKDLPEGFEAVITKCMARDRDKRFASVVELVEALRPYMAEGTTHRIETVKQAAVAPPAEIDDEPLLEVSEASSDSPKSPKTPRVDDATSESSPDAIRDKLVLAPTALSGRGAAAAADAKHITGAAKQSGASEKPAAALTGGSHPSDRNAPETAMTSSSVVTGLKPVKPPSSRKLLPFIALGVIVIGGAIGLAASRAATTKGTSPATTEASSTITTPPAAAPSAAVSMPSSESPPMVPTGAGAITATARTAAPPSASVAPAPRPLATAARPAARPTTTAAAATTPAPKVSAPALILDRK